MVKTKNKGSTYFYQLSEEPEYHHDRNVYFKKYAKDKNIDHFNAFLHWHEPIINEQAREFMALYDVPNHFLEDMKQIYAHTVWLELQCYKADDNIVLLQKVRYKILDAWHDFVRTVCGTVTIPKRGTYKRLRQVARLYFAELDTMPDWELVMKIADQLKLEQSKVWELVFLAYAFRYPTSIDEEPCTDEYSERWHEKDVMDRIPPVDSAEIEYSQWVLDEELLGAISQLSENDQRLFEMHIGMCINCFRNKEKLKYREIAEILGYPSENAVAKRKAVIMKQLREKLTDARELIQWEW